MVYMTSKEIEEEMKANSTIKKKKPNPIPLNKAIVNQAEEAKLNVDKFALVDGKKTVQVLTEKYIDQTWPRPLSFDVPTQKDDDRVVPILRYEWPVQTGIDKCFQVEDGDLFQFDLEVEPLLNVLTTKTLEQSRMEVLEEEEVEVLKLHQREFHELKRQELMEVQRLENEEIQRREEIKQLVKQKKLASDEFKNAQKQLISRVFSKVYLSHLKNNTLNFLISNGIFRSPILTQYHHDLLPPMIEDAVEIFKSDLLLSKRVNYVLYTSKIMDDTEIHKEAIIRERQRKEKLEILRLEEKEKKRLERQKRKEEEALRKKEQERLLLKKEIYNQLLNQAEFVEYTDTVFDPIGNYQSGKKFASLTSGFIGQWSLVINILNRILREKQFEDSVVDKEKFLKILEFFIPKMPPMVFNYDESEMNRIKEIDDTINSPEDFVKADDDKWVSKCLF